jgi:cystathionine beta-synthase
MHSEGTYENIYDLIGHTPLVRLKALSELTRSDVYGKLEYYNPGQSVKDRIVIHMIEKAEAEGKLQEGSTIVEATSGNTGFSIAMIAAAKGYRCVLAVKDTISSEKQKSMEALGATIVKCPASLPGDHPDSYYETARRIASETEGGYYLNQNFDLENSRAHYLTTGPEVYAQTKGKVTHFIACASTGGTVSGTGKYLKEQNPDINIIAVDACTGVLKKYHETGEFHWDRSKKTKLEGVGKNIIPDNVQFDIIDRFVMVNDEDSAYAGKYLAREEGIFVGYSSGAALAGMKKIANEIRPGSTVVILFPDHGSRYLNKLYDPTWMVQQGYLNGSVKREEPAEGVGVS